MSSARRKEYRHNYYLSHKEIEKERNRAYFLAHPEVHRKANRKYYSKLKERYGYGNRGILQQEKFIDDFIEGILQSKVVEI